jgi:hypothetical protein
LRSAHHNSCVVAGLDPVIHHRDRAPGRSPDQVGGEGRRVGRPRRYQNQFGDWYHARRRTRFGAERSSSGAR